jgi:hypothetical protein
MGKSFPDIARSLAEMECIQSNTIAMHSDG